MLIETEYGQVVKMLGNGRLDVKCQDGEMRTGQIRGQLRKKVRLILSTFYPAEKPTSGPRCKGGPCWCLNP